jgi:hypothetical protein
MRIRAEGGATVRQATHATILPLRRLRSFVAIPDQTFTEAQETGD